MNFNLQVLHQGWKRVLPFSCSFKIIPIGYDAFFRRKYFWVMIVSIVCPTVFGKVSDKSSSTISTSVKDKNQEESMNKTISKDTQG